MEMVMATVKTLRAVRAAESLERQRKEKLHAFALCGNASTQGILRSHDLEIRTLANVSSFEVLEEEDEAARTRCASVETVNELKVYLTVDGGEGENIRSKIGEIHI
ncbi:unnamed protein product [Microthlaspi erraticum]|uniref:Uncharacterized protein n=1 Tax=Microthlaspi erraticum TaxID=1685480 RepID=A0A6D2J3U6_9BRAS|nr:unnamed protein product [Microthlaspi erraticum]